MIGASILACVLLTTTVIANECREGPLQNNINFKKLAGDWDQVYFSSGAAYDMAICVESRIFNVSVKESSLTMLSKALTIKNTKVRPERHIVKSTANWARGNDNGINIKDQIVTDYNNYLIFYSCESGRPFMDVRVRRGRTLRSRNIRKIADVADVLGVDFFSLNERPNGGCRRY